MRDTAQLIAAVGLGTLVVTRVLGWIIERFREPLYLVGNLVLRVCAAALVVMWVVDAATRGGLWLLALPLLLLAAWQFFVAVTVIRVWAREGLDGITGSAP